MLAVWLTLLYFQTNVYMLSSVYQHNVILCITLVLQGIQDVQTDTQGNRLYRSCLSGRVGFVMTI